MRICNYILRVTLGLHTAQAPAEVIVAGANDLNENLAALDVPGVEVVWAEERLDSDTAGLGVVDGGRCIRVDDVRVGLGVVDAVPYSRLWCRSRW